MIEYSLLELNDMSLFNKDLDLNPPPLISDEEMELEIVEAKKKDKSFVDDPKLASPISFLDSSK